MYIYIYVYMCTHIHTYTQAENDGAQPPARDLPHHWDAARVNKAIANWQGQADSEDKTAWGTF
jgi:hypothetical protein